MKNFDERMESIRHKSQQLRSQKRRRSAIVLACTGVFAAALLLTLFVPYSTALPSVAQYKDSPYYNVIEKLNAYSYTPPQYKNRFEKLMGALSDSFTMMAPAGDFVNGAQVPESSPAVDDDASNGNGNYVEVTDNQVEGVIEADIFKRSDRYIYHLYDDQLNIYTIAGEDSEKVASYAVSDLLPQNEKLLGDMDMYLSEDCRTLTLVMLVKSHEAGRYACLFLNLDVTSPEYVKATNHVLFYGTGYQTRMTDGQFLLMYQAQCSNAVDFDDPKTFVPAYGTAEETLCIPGEDIVVPESIRSKTYSVVCKLDASTLELLDSKALMSYSTDVYVSQDNIYSYYSYWNTIETNSNGDVTKRLITDITCIGYSGEGLEVKKTFTVEGQLRDQYSMDEYDGLLRVVSSTVADQVEKNTFEPQPDIWMEPANKSVNLYCLDLETGEVAGKVEGFAPQGEEATSVRFDGTTAYVCTAEIMVMSDPVFFFDLSDPKNITWTDTGIIDGYSTSLVNFGEGTLLGIGFDESENLKVEVYREEDGKVVSVASYVQACSFSQDYKDYFIDRENGYVGLAVYSGEIDRCQYLLLHFDGEKLVVEKQLVLDVMSVLEIRADIIDGWLYVLAEDLTVVKP